MKPETLSQNFGSELPPIQYGNNIERGSDTVSNEKEAKETAGQYEQRRENSTVSSDVNSTTMLLAPVGGALIVDENTTVCNNPLIANDDDLIEKEWVDKAKKIVSDTRDNPHQREKAVNELQIDYLKKRYGRGLDVAR